MPLEHGPDDPLGLLVVAKVPLEPLLQPVLNTAAHLVPARLGQLGHVLPHLRRVLGQGQQQPLQVGGDQDVHGGGHGVVKLPVPVVDPLPEEFGEHVVAVGGADQLVDGQAHLFGVVGGQDVAEVAGGNADIHRLAGGNLLVPEQIAVGGDVVDDLRQHPAPVDGVCGGEEVAPAGQLLAE